MDVELQVRKHLPRDAQPTVSWIDEYCSGYQDLFPEVRSYECFKSLHLGILSPIKRKTLPEIAKVVGLNSPQSLHHFLAQSPWSVVELRARRLSQIRSVLAGRKITAVIDETGDRKKGKKTDYVARQYLGSMGKIEQGIVSVNAYGIKENVTFPLLFKVFKPKGTLKPEDQYKTKVELASEIIEELLEFGLSIDLVLTDSLYGESSSFRATLDKHQLPWVLAIRSNHGVRMPWHQTVRANKWCKFERIFSDQSSETRWIRGIIFGQRRKRTYWEITTDPQTMPENSTSFVMTNLAGSTSQIKKVLGNLYGLRTWIEYGFRQSKQELGWTDYRLTKFEQIEKWWEIIMSAYWLVSWHSICSCSCSLAPPSSDTHERQEETQTSFSRHRQWSTHEGWKSTLNNLRLILQPLLLFWMIVPWLDVFPNPHLWLGLAQLIQVMNQFHSYFPDG